MKINYIIADSGGTKTDWCFFIENDDKTKQKIFHITESYHPNYIDENFILHQIDFWKKYDIRTCKLFFYGSGCLLKENKEKTKNLFQKLGFKNILVESDILAVSLSLEKECEIKGICGTGSVLFKHNSFNNNFEFYGGLGWKLGDEGSGFYFGKLLVEKINFYKKKYPEILNILEDYYSLQYLKNIINKIESKKIFSSLSLIFKDYAEHPFISAIHIENIQLFLKKYVNNISSISLVGSYAYNLKIYFEAACKTRKIELIEVIERPIFKLADFYFKREFDL
jgi:hypothetical protein